MKLLIQLSEVYPTLANHIRMNQHDISSVCIRSFSNEYALLTSRLMCYQQEHDRIAHMQSCTYPLKVHHHFPAIRSAEG